MTASEIVPAATPDEIAGLPAEQHGEMITHALVESKAWLAVATKGTDPTPITEFKAWAATVAEMTRQKGLAAEIQVGALEMVRRAERGIGLAIRNGQEAGEIARQYIDARPRRDYERNGKTVHVGQVPERTLSSPADYVASGQVLHETYAMTDDVSDAQFEAALSDAKAEGNLSRANVVRKIQGVKSDGLTPVEKLVKIRDLAPRGYTSGQIAAEIGASESYVRDLARENGIKISADEVLRGTHRVKVDGNHLVGHLVMTLEVVTNGLDRVDIGALDEAQTKNWADSLTTTTRELNRFVKRLKESTQ